VKVQRAEVADAITRDGETAVLVGRRLVRLSELSAAIWVMAEDTVDIRQLAEHLESEFGSPEGRSTLDATKHAVAEMLRHGVLVECR
jgi:hypothetical protein